MKNRKWILRGIMSIMLSILLGACTPPTPKETLPPSITSTPLPTSRTSPIATPTHLPSPLQTPVSPLAPPAIPQSDDTSSTPTAPINTLIVRVAKSEGLAPEDLEILSMAETTWNDTSLGCPQPDMVYAQILVSGWLIRLQDAAGNEYEIHTGKDMEPFIVCDTGTTIIRPLPDRPPQSNPAVDAAIRWLAENKNISSETVLVKSIESVQWPDSCLGCPQTKETCLMVVTPGYRIVLLSEDQTYELYTDEIGRNVRHCTTLDGTPSVKE